jgi:hypothetical protein
MLKLRRHHNLPTWASYVDLVKARKRMPGNSLTLGFNTHVATEASHNTTSKGIPIEKH